MVTTRFIRDDVLWREILACAGKPDRKLAAVAYMATESASLLPLQRGERLVVDMSLDTVKRGSTDPREIREFMQRGGACLLWRSPCPPAGFKEAPQGSTRDSQVGGKLGAIPNPVRHMICGEQPRVESRAALS
jgi:hypothetical protein